MYCYCLMENHMHMLLDDQNGNLDVFMKKLGVSYVAYYNRKYCRVGRLIQDRFKSEPVETEVYFSTVFRYILQNPEKAHVCKTRDYIWSLYKEYATDEIGATDVGFASK